MNKHRPEGTDTDYVATQQLVKEMQDLLRLEVPQWVFPEITYSQKRPTPISWFDDVPKESPIEDLLGLYSFDSEEKRLEITIYARECEECARALGVSTRVLIRVVLCHEAAHFVTHKGTHEKVSWVKYSQAERKIKEKLAQIITLLILHETGDQEGEAVFRELAKHQRDPYNDWKDWDFANTGISFEESRERVRKEIYDLIDASFLKDVCDDTYNPNITDAHLL